jgi:hypothetical protein
MSQPDAEKRVAHVFDQAQKAKQHAVDKAGSRSLGLQSLLVGAFSASYMATSWWTAAGRSAAI